MLGLAFTFIAACGFPFGIRCGDCELDDDCGDDQQCADGDCSDLGGQRIVCNDCLLDTDAGGGYENARLRVQLFDPDRDEPFTRPVIWVRSDESILDGVECRIAIDDLPGVSDRVIWGEGELVRMELDLRGTCITTSTSATAYGGSFLLVHSDDDPRAAVPLVIDDE